MKLNNYGFKQAGSRHYEKLAQVENLYISGIRISTFFNCAAIPSALRNGT